MLLVFSSSIPEYISNESSLSDGFSARGSKIPLVSPTFSRGGKTELFGKGS